ncbi:MAG: hypothetical protein BECKG1743D_GA0114223_106064 [Candidatus Kentron sp. G]|nr:MAG: hypothetical protein BECKG1743F_GA0114225_105864 [Candidatus Kentron sp. G]VFN02662.1 MAG: hypothetical protein BECKG1743E_GA0114224_105304 [Candidatus Kentron sp. G]VFN04573.1 MAG: hypothetical protein BECKG1743D_GA0114223_106064 [Candidatus Kentron sp. G]
MASITDKLGFITYEGETFGYWDLCGQFHDIGDELHKEKSKRGRKNRERIAELTDRADVLVALRHLLENRGDIQKTREHIQSSKAPDAALRALNETVIEKGFKITKRPPARRGRPPADGFSQDKRRPTAFILDAWMMDMARDVASKGAAKKARGVTSAGLRMICQEYRDRHGWEPAETPEE